MRRSVNRRRHKWSHTWAPHRVLGTAPRAHLRRGGHPASRSTSPLPTPAAPRQRHRLSGTRWMPSLGLLTTAAGQPNPAFLGRALPGHAVDAPQPPRTRGAQGVRGARARLQPSLTAGPPRATSAAGQGVPLGPPSPADPPGLLPPPGPGAPGASQTPAVPAPPRSLPHHLPSPRPQQRAVTPTSREGKGHLVAGTGFRPTMLGIIKPIVLLRLQLFQDDP